MGARCPQKFRIAQDAQVVQSLAKQVSWLTTTCTFTNTEQFPSLTLVKSASSASYNTVGQVITYTYTISNSGNTTLAGPFSVSDDKQPTVSCPTGSLAPGASITCTSTRTITLADIDAGSITNTATASGNGVTSNQASATVTASLTKTLTIAKSASPTTYSTVGQVITYTYTITNSGNTTLDGPFSVSDDKQPTVSCPTGSLAPGASITCTSTRTITLADINAGSITNTATASGNGVASSVVSVTVIANQAMSIDLVDSATTPTFSSPPVAGDTINFSYKITNTGNVTLSGVVLIDASLPGFETPGGICGGKTTFSPGASITCSGIYM
ncbi:MAG: hypothetical protein DMG20_02245 [Acidobacteria bacterium]|nr:MAG: hypothetical protein DMG20_02245 [Acidobacteriota bacterium]